jgi:hypothetical protein
LRVSFTWLHPAHGFSAAPELVRYKDARCTLCVVSRVTEIEAERLEEARPDREAFLRQLRTDIEQQSRERGVVVHFPDAGTSTGDEPQPRA